MSNVARSLRRLIPLILFLSFGAVVGLAQPAHADPCSPWSGEDAMRNAPASCRGTWLVEPGIGNFMTREKLLAANDLYNHFGFSRQWRWYAPESQVTVTDPGQQWAYCLGGSASDEFCPIPQVRTTNNGLLGSFGGQAVTLRTFSHEGRHVARVCGNFFTTGGSHADPVPRLTVEKFDDRNRNGVRDAGENGVSGWEFRVVRNSSKYADQGTGHVETVTTGGDGRVEVRFDGKGPGVYTLEEVSRAGWAPTTAPARTVMVDDGIGDAHLGTYRFGNAEIHADLVKVDFGLVSPPERLEAGQSTDLTVRAVLRNDGPADVTARDSVEVEVPADCVAEPASAEVTRALPRGASTTVDFLIRVRCEDPSYHPVTFTDRLTVATAGVTDPDPSDNTVAFEHVFEVYDRADITLTGTTASCPARADVGEEFTCTASAIVGNAGPYGPVTVVVTFGLTGPKDCPRTSVGGSDHQIMSIPAGESVEVTVIWRVFCEQRSDHEFLVLASAALDHLHVEDPVENNSDGMAHVAMEIFEPADLYVRDLDIRCSEREHNTTASECTATVVVGNNGVATHVAAVSTLAIALESDCDEVPPKEDSFSIDAGEERVMTATWSLTCASTDRHAVRVTASVRPDEPHAEDRNSTNDSTSAIWGPVDVKPGSLPSSINLGKEGLVPFAVLSTATLDTLTAIDPTSLTFGRTGTESSVVGCAVIGEDVNGDGRLDLICRADTRLIDLTCDTTVLRLIGQTTDGVRFYGEDDVKVVGCR